MSAATSLESKFAGLTLQPLRETGAAVPLTGAQASTTVQGILSAGDVQFDVAKISGSNRALFQQLSGSVRSLCLCDQPALTSEKIVKLAAAMPNITHFCANNTSFDLGCLQALVGMRKVTHLNLCSTKLWSASVERFDSVLACFQKFTALISLGTCDRRITSTEKCRIAAALPNLQKLSQQPTLEAVFDHFLSMETEGAARLSAEDELFASATFDAFSRSASLFQLAIIEHAATAFHASSIFEEMRSKRHFDCSVVPQALYMHVDDSIDYELRHTARVGLLFRELTLPEEKLIPSDFGNLLSYFQNQRVLHMGAQAAHLTDEYIFNIMLLEHLTELDMGHAVHITDAGMSALANAMCDGFLPKLKKLDISGCTKLTAQCFTFTLYIEGLELVLSPAQKEQKKQALAAKFGAQASVKK